MARASLMLAGGGLGADSLVVADSGNNRVRVVSLATNVTTTLAGSGGYGGEDGVGVYGVSFAFPTAVAVAGDGAVVFVADSLGSRVRTIHAATGTVATLGGRRDGQAGSADGDGGLVRSSFFYPRGVALNAAGTQLAVADTSNHRVRTATAPSSFVLFPAALASLSLGVGDTSGAVTVMLSPAPAAGVALTLTFTSERGRVAVVTGGGTVQVSGGAATAEVTLRGIAPGEDVLSVAVAAGSGAGAASAAAAATFVSPHAAAAAVVVSPGSVALSGVPAGGALERGTTATLHATASPAPAAGTTLTLTLITLTKNGVVVSSGLAASPSAVTLTNDAPTAAFTLAASTVGEYAVEYTLTGADAHLYSYDASDWLTVTPCASCAGSTVTVAGGGSPATLPAGEAGFRDGEGTAARFNGPTAVAATADGAVLFVADAGNAALRAVNNATVGALYKLNPGDP
jgi:hypothetical protein